MLALGAAIGRVMTEQDIVSLVGPLGAGKTSLARGILSGLGYQGEVPSPTFSILQYYHPPETRFPVVHADFYRLEGAGELEELGLDPGGEDGGLIAEWAENIGGVAGVQTLELRIAATDASARCIKGRPGANWTERWTGIAEWACTARQ